MQQLARKIASDIRLDECMPGESDMPRRLDDVMKRLAIPGASVTAIESGEIAWASGWGLTDSVTSAPVTPSTLFQAGSISKPVAALCALRLIASGDLELDAPINDRLTSWRLPTNSGWEARITVRHLLSHTAGTTVHGFPGYRRDVPIPTLIDVLDGRGNTAPVRVRTIPGYQYSYSGGGYLVLQQLLIDITGSAFPELVDQIVLKPLGMLDSTFAQPLPDGLWERAASGHRTGGGRVTCKWHVYPEMSAGGLWTTSSDLARFIGSVWGARRGQSDPILPLELAEEMLTQQAPNFQVGLGLKLNAGIGMSFRGEGSGLRFGHGGDDQGFVAMMLIYTETGDGAVVMTNSDDGLLVIKPLLEALSRHSGWDDGREADEKKPMLRVEPTTLAGTYRLSDGRSIELATTGTELQLVTPGQEPIELARVDALAWRAKSVAALLTFSESESGQPRVTLSQEAMYVKDVDGVRVG